MHKCMFFFLLLLCTFCGNTNPVEVACEFPWHIGFASSRKPNHHYHRWGVCQVWAPMCWNTKMKWNTLLHFAETKCMNRTAISLRVFMSMDSFFFSFNLTPVVARMISQNLLTTPANQTTQPRARSCAHRCTFKTKHLLHLNAHGHSSKTLTGSDADKSHFLVHTQTHKSSRK